mmetsp:Transcript_15094/g.34366  ORF Transcript_15094/g.34366 Transcript_15094/m.34366 type:complete len:464 (-) Transcript_15094:129-1520(-)
MAASKDMPQPTLEQWQQLQDALDTIDYPAKRVYLQALRQVPHLCAEETNPLQFLTYCRGNVWSAAQRLCLYWRERFDLFQDRAFLPLNLTSRGSALTNQDLLCLQGGYPAVLPKTKTGQPVFLVDRRQLTPQATPEVRLRCMFYLGKLFASKEYPAAQTEGQGILALHLLVMPKLMAMDRDFLKYVKRANGLLETVFPIRVQYRVICMIPKGGKGYIVQNLIANYVKSMIGENDAARQKQHKNKNNGETKTFDKILDVHIEQDEQLLLQELTTGTGLSPENIPDFLGGKYSMLDAALWCQQQARLEREEKAQRERWLKRQKKLMARWQKQQQQQQQQDDSNSHSSHPCFFKVPVAATTTAPANVATATTTTTTLTPPPPPIPMIPMMPLLPNSFSICWTRSDGKRPYSWRAMPNPSWPSKRPNSWPPTALSVSSCAVVSMPLGIGSSFDNSNNSSNNNTLATP